VERHNGVDGDRFWSGISRGVMGGERAPAVTEAEGGGAPGGGNARVSRRQWRCHARVAGGGRRKGAACQ
jgi:hypothetical protein